MSNDAVNRIIAELSKRLAQERESRGLSKKRLASLAGIDRSTIAFVEDPTKNPTLYSLLRYALALDLDLGSLISDCQRVRREVQRPTGPKTQRK